MRSVHHFVLILLVTLAVSACNNEQLQIGQQPDGVVEYEDPSVPANTIELEEGLFIEPGIHMRPGIAVYDVLPASESGVTFTEDGASVVLTGAARNDVAGIEEGDILVTSQTITMVASLDGDDDQLELGLRSFELWEAVHGEWSIEVPLNRGEGDRYDVSPSDYEVRRQLLSQSHEVAFSASSGGVKLSTSSTLSYGAEPSLRFEGKIPFYSSESDYHCEDPQVKVDLACAFGRCAKRYRYCVDYLSLRVEVSADYDTSTSLTATAKEEFKYPEEKRAVSKGLGQIPLAGPFFLRPEFYIDRQAYAKAVLEGELKISASAGATIPLGFEYRNGHGYNMIPNGADGASTRSSLGGEASLEAKLEAGIWAEAGLALSVCTPDLPADVCVEGLTAGGRVTIKGEYADGTSTSGPRDHCLKVSAEFKASITAKAKARISAFGFDRSLTLFEASFTPYSRVIASWDDGGEYCSGAHEQLVSKFNDQYDIDLDCADEEQNALIGTCAEAFAAHCFSPSGACNGKVYEDGSYDQIWDSGEHIFGNALDSTTLASGVDFTTEYERNMFGADGTPCVAGQSVIQPILDNPYDCRSATEMTLLVSDEEEVAGGFLEGDVLSVCVLDSGAQVFTCPDGERFTLGGDRETLCVQGGSCKFEAGFLDDLEENRGSW